MLLCLAIASAIQSPMFGGSDPAISMEKLVASMGTPLSQFKTANITTKGDTLELISAHNGVVDLLSKKTYFWMWDLDQNRVRLYFFPMNPRGTLIEHPPGKDLQLTGFRAWGNIVDYKAFGMTAKNADVLWPGKLVMANPNEFGSVIVKLVFQRAYKEKQLIVITGPVSFRIPSEATYKGEVLTSHGAKRKHFTIKRQFISRFEGFREAYITVDDHLVKSHFSSTGRIGRLFLQSDPFAKTTRLERFMLSNMDDHSDHESVRVDVID